MEEIKKTSKWKLFANAIVGKEDIISVSDSKKAIQQTKEDLFRITADYNSRTMFAVSFDGEKNLGGIGPIKEYLPAYDLLRLRSWQAYMESDIAHTLLNRITTWVVGKGLKLQSEPSNDLLKLEGLEIDVNQFSNEVEARFNAFRKSRKTDYSGMRNLDLIAEEAYLNAIIGGDCLVVQRFDGKNITEQIIDGCHIQSPMYGSEWYPQQLANGNKIINGVEVDAKGQHVAYWIRNNKNGFDKIDARGKSTGLLMAFMVYGMKHRLDDVRGIPLITVILETLKKLERYKEATVGSAEERQKIVYQIVHKEFSDGSNPLLNDAAKAINYRETSDKIPEDVNGKQLANTVAASTEKETFNMPVGSELKGLESKNELYFKDFYTVNINIVCATLNIPPDVAMSLYNSNYSASRAAIKDWEHTISVKRDRFSFYFYQPIYDFWMWTQVLTNKIKAPGYLQAFLEQNEMVLGAYRNARFVGANVPHIDPLKEVQAERLKLGDSAASVPLTTVESATEALNGGDSGSNIEQYAKELKKTKDLGIKPEVEEKTTIKEKTTED